MKKNNIPFSPPDISEKEIQEVVEVLKSGWITTGPKTKQFEKTIADYVGVNKAVCLNSATAALELALRLLDIKEGDEVIVPAYTYTASCSVIYHVGATPVMIDCAPGSFEMNYDELEQKITDKTKAIIPVELAGIICDYSKIFKAIENKKQLFKPSNEIQKAIGRVIVISDSAHAFGASRDGVMAGAIADFSAFSFHAVKNLTTAEGGALTWKSIDGIDDEKIYKDLQNLSLHGQTKDALSKNKIGAWEYDIVSPAFKCNMTDIMAGIGLAQFERYPKMLAWRKEIITRYNKAFAQLPVQLLNHFENTHISSGHLYFVKVEGIDEAKRNEIIVKMAEKGIACNVHYKPLPMLTAYKNKGFDIQDYPNAYNQYKGQITLPLYSKLTEEEVDYIIQSFIESMRECGCI